MPRRPSVRYFASRGAYYCQINKVQNHLATGPDDYPNGPTYRAAVNKFRELIEQSVIEEVGDANTVRIILEEYMHQAESVLDAATHKRRWEILRPFVDALGDLSIRELSLLRVNAFIRAQREPRVHEWESRKGKKIKRTSCWGDSTVSTFLKAARAGFSWAVRAKLIPSNPLAEVEDPGIRSRSRDCLISPEQHQAILRAARSRGMRALLTGLENTGARPEELTAARGADFDENLGAIVYYGDDRRRIDEYRHKTAGKQKDRVIYFTGPALDYVKRRAKIGPKAILFPSMNGKAYGKKSVQAGVHLLKSRLKLRGFTAMSYRHTFATNWLKAGKSIEILAELLGNTPETIRKHYAHLCADREGIRRHLEAFRDEAAGSTPLRCDDGTPPE